MVARRRPTSSSRATSGPVPSGAIRRTPRTVPVASTNSTCWAWMVGDGGSIPRASTKGASSTCSMPVVRTEPQRPARRSEARILRSSMGRSFLFNRERWIWALLRGGSERNCRGPAIECRFEHPPDGGDHRVRLVLVDAVPTVRHDHVPPLGRARRDRAVLVEEWCRTVWSASAGKHDQRHIRQLARLNLLARGIEVDYFAVEDRPATEVEAGDRVYQHQPGHVLWILACVDLINRCRVGMSHEHVRS